MIAIIYDKMRNKTLLSNVFKPWYHQVVYEYDERCLIGVFRNDEHENEDNECQYSQAQ